MGEQRVYNPAKEALIKVHGRTVAQEGGIPLFWTGSGIEFVTDAANVTIALDVDYGYYEQWIRVELNGYSVVKTSLARGRNEIVVYRNFPEDGEKRRVRVFREFQPIREDEANKLIVTEVIADGALYEVPAPSCRIEFIGDSITSGEGLGGFEGTNAWTPAIFTTDKHYAFETARKLNADISILSQSGWGTFCSWDNKPECAMPLYYRQVCGLMLGQQAKSLGALDEYDFEKWQPDVIVVNLGTNDGGCLDQPAYTDADGNVWKQQKSPNGKMEPASEARFKNAMNGFLRLIREKNPSSRILWVYGMLGNVMEQPIRECLEAYVEETGDDKTRMLMLPDSIPGTLGANNHPGIASHAATAQVLADYIESWLSNEA